MTTGGARRLVLLRHAKAESPGRLADELRPLSLTGRRQSTAVGARLVAADLLPELVLVSSAVRTRQTWELVRGTLAGLPSPQVDVTDRLYDADLGEMLRVVAEVDERVRTLLVVGHEPTVSATASFLAGDHGDAGGLSQVRTGLPTGAMAVLEMRTAWAACGPGSAQLLEVVRPATG